MKIPDIRGDVLVEETAPDIFKITLPQPFYAPNHLYFIRDDEPLLVDSGYAESIGQLAVSLRKIGSSLNKVRTVLYTHPHIDHISAGLLFTVYAGKIRRAGHYAMPGDIPDYPRFIDEWQGDTARLLRIAFRDHKTRQQRIRRANERWKNFVKRFYDPSRKRGDLGVRLDIPLREGDSIETGRHKVKIIETPGHCKWHITPYEAEKKYIFTGDLIIGNIPAIYDALDGNLEDYYRTLDRLTDFADYRFFPAHGEEILEPARRVKLLKKTLGILEKGVLRRLQEGEKNLVELLESAIGGQIEGGGHFITALSLIESLVRKAAREGVVHIEKFSDGYELYSLVR